MALLSTLCFFVVSCSRPTGGRVYLLNDSRVLSGTLAPQKGVDLKSINIALIDRNGLRVSPSNLKFDPDKGNFSFQLRDSDLYEPRKGTVLDRLMSMGNPLPLVGLGDDPLVGRADQYARLEIFPKLNETLDYQVSAYFQAMVPLSRKNLLTGTDVIGVDGQITLAKAGFVRIKVTDEAGKPIAGVRVAGIADGKLQSNAPLWHDTLLRPVFVTTRSDGSAFIGPVDASVELTRYYILAVADGYCTYLSAPTNNFSLVEKIAPTVKLKSCNKSEEGSHDLYASFPEGLKYLDVKGRKIVHTKEDSLLLRLDSRTDNLRGVKVSVYEANENFEPSLEPTGEIREASIFQSEFTIGLPKIFKLTDATEGKFIIKVTRIPGETDGAELSQVLFPDLIVYGHKRVVVPSRDTLMKVNLGAAADVTDGPTQVDDWTNLKIASLTGTTNIVPGLAGGKFTMSSPLCAEGDGLGFSIPAYGMIEPVFKDCVNNVATFTAEEVGFISRAQQIQQFGGRQKWRVFWKDKFGNVSDTLEDPNAPSPKRLNVVTVIVDTARPFLSDIAESNLPLNSLEFVKTTGMTAEKLTGESKPLKAADIKAGLVKLRFERIGGVAVEKNCVQSTANDATDERNRNGLLGVNATYLTGINAFIQRDDLARLVVRSAADYEDAGLLIYRWVIAGSSTAVLNASENTYTRCREKDPSVGAFAVPQPLTVERTLQEGDVVYNASSGQAEFYMRFMDVAGLYSNPIKYTVPVCTAGATGLCWSNSP